MATDEHMHQPEVRPPYVQFERRPIEDRDASIKAGRIVCKDVDFVQITPIGSRDVIDKTIPDWFEGLDTQANGGRIPAAWVSQYKAAYKAWQDGQEIPVNGTPIRGWGLISPAMQENCTRANVRTVEDLAQANEESLWRIGMGALDLKNKAIQWIKAQTGPGKLVKENEDLKAKVAAQDVRLETLTKQVADLMATRQKESA